MVQRRGKREEKEKNEKRNRIGSGIDILDYDPVSGAGGHQH